MAAPVLTAMPATFPAGSTLEFTWSDSRYPSNAGWTAKLHVATVTPAQPGQVAQLELTGTVSGSAFAFLATPTATRNLVAGGAEWQIWVRETATGKEYCAAASRTKIQPNIRIATAGSMVTQTEKLLALVEAAIENRLTKDQEQSTVDNMLVVHVPLVRLWEIRSQLLDQRAAERRGAGGQFGYPIRATFPGVDAESA